MALIPWQQAWEQALYGPTGFYRGEAGPAAHFRTSAQIPEFAEALVRLASEVAANLGQPDGFTVVDVGAGRGELLTMMATTAPEGWRLLGVDVVTRPEALTSRVDWATEVQPVQAGLLMAHELLDVVPCPVVEADENAVVRTVLVDPETGMEELGGPVAIADKAWLDRWWPGLAVGERAEVGRPRDERWQELVGLLGRGAVLAVDYSHDADARGAGRWSHGSLTGFRNGRGVEPVPDGSCDLTAHVALDACAAATEALVDATLLTNQRDALGALGVGFEESTGPSERRESLLRALRTSSAAAELRDPEGLGGFGWLMQLRGLPGMPAAVSR